MQRGWESEKRERPAPRTRSQLIFPGETYLYLHIGGVSIRAPLAGGASRGNPRVSLKVVGSGMLHP